MINKKMFLSLLLITAIAMCTGSFFEVFMKGAGKDDLMNLLSSTFSIESTFGFLSILKTSFISQIKLWGILLLCPLIPILIFICPCICFIKGLSVGFSSTMLIETFGVKGVIYILLTIMPHSIIQLPIFCILSTVSIEMSIILFKFYLLKNSRKRNINALQNSAKHYLTIFGYGFVILFISSLIEACLKQFLL